MVTIDITDMEIFGHNRPALASSPYLPTDSSSYLTGDLFPYLTRDSQGTLAPTGHTEGNRQAGKIQA